MTLMSELQVMLNALKPATALCFRRALLHITSAFNMEFFFFDFQKKLHINLFYGIIVGIRKELII